MLGLQNIIAAAFYLQVRCPLCCQTDIIKDLSQTNSNQ